MKRIVTSLAAVLLAMTMMIPAMAEDTATDTTTSLADAQTAYAAAKQASTLTEYEAELKSMVEAGTLTQEQADLLLTAAKETIALRNGVCPQCGYEFQTTTGKNGRGFGKSFGVNGRKTATTASSDDETALQQAQDAYNAAKESTQLTDYEAELKSMVEAGSLTQEQADELLAAAKEAESLASGVCPSCGYQFVTTTGIGSGSSDCGMKNGKGHGGRH